MRKNYIKKLLLGFITVVTSQAFASQPQTSSGSEPVKVYSDQFAQSSTISIDSLRIMANSGKRKQAITLAEKYLQVNKKDHDVRVFLGLMLSWEGQYDLARQQFQIVLNESPSNTDAGSGLANVELWTGHNVEALRVINAALKYEPENKILLAQKQKIQEASKSKAQPNPKIKSETASKLKTETKVNKKAKTTQKQKSKIQPQKKTAASYEQIKILAHTGHREQAIQLAEQSLQVADNDDIRVLLGLMYSWDGKYEQSRQQFETVLQHKPAYSDASEGLVNVEIWSNNYKRALSVADNGLKYNPKDEFLLAKRAIILQNGEYPGASALLNLPAVIGPNSPGRKKNALILDQGFSYVDDLKQTWSSSSLAYERYTDYGSIIFTVDRYYKFKKPGAQYLVEAYPHLFKGSYLYLGYGYSSTSYIAQNYIGFEPFFSLPHAFEFSIGERYLQFQSSVARLYTGSIGKYSGNYWFALRPYVSEPSSYTIDIIARRYFSSPSSYITLTLGSGSGPSTYNLLQPNSMSANHSKSIRLDGEYPLSTNFVFTWDVGFSRENFPNNTVRSETDADVGLIYRF